MSRKQLELAARPFSSVLSRENYGRNHGDARLWNISGSFLSYLGHGSEA